MPFRDRKKFTRRQIFQYSLTATLLIALLGVVGHFKQGFESRFSNEIIQTAAPASFFTGQKINCHRDGNSYKDLDASCVLGNSKNVIGALIGDSHANAISTQLGLDIEKHNIGLYQMTFNGCPAIQGVYRADMDINKCSEFNAEVLAYLKQHQELKYVVLVSRWTRYLKNTAFANGEGGLEYGHDMLDVINENNQRIKSPEADRIEKIREKYLAQVNALVQMGKKVILVYPIPEAGWNVPDFLVKQKMFSDKPLKFSTSYQLFKERNQLAIDTFDSIDNQENLFRVYPHRLLCDSFLAERCVFELDGHSLYFDTNHLSNAGAKLINQDIIKFLPH